MSCLVLSCLVLSCLVLSCLVLSCLVLSCLVLSCLVLSCLVLSYVTCNTVHARGAIINDLAQPRPGALHIRESRRWHPKQPHRSCTQAEVVAQDAVLLEAGGTGIARGLACTREEIRRACIVGHKSCQAWSADSMHQLQRQQASKSSLWRTASVCDACVTDEVCLRQSAAAAVSASRSLHASPVACA